jgi:hypothetical protein
MTPTAHGPDPSKAAALDRLAAKAEEMKRLLRAEREKARAAVLAELEALAGPEDFRALLQSAEATEQALADPRPAVRRCALYLAMKHWGLGGRYAGLCEQRAREDPDEGVREEATYLLGSHHADTNDARIGVLLASIVRAEGEAPAVRLSAYCGLVCLRGLADRWRPRLTELRFPEDVDWALVSSFDRPGSEA